ncbi:MAG: hypothetical protein Q9166_003795 [cf. Caloplaca sp. 2 TL-2023]
MAVPVIMDLTRHIPKPTYEFVIPSIHDETHLACRIYSVPEIYFGGRREPEDVRPLSPHEKPWTPRGAVIAHPYTGFGGSYDDKIVLEAVRQFMIAGFTVGTFNLRGAGESAGKSTWTGKAELQDYISFVGFFMYYLSGVFPPVPGEHPFDDFFGLTPILSGVPATRPPAHFVLGGYSYGALLTRWLPNVPAILGRFSKVLKTSTEAEIRHRASRLAAVTVIDILSNELYPSARESRRSKSKLLIDKNRAEEKKTHIGYLQTPFVRKHERNSWPDEKDGEGPFDEDFIKRVEVPTPKIHYLLISLLLGKAASFVTGFKKLRKTDTDVMDEKFMFNTTAIIHGFKDRISSVWKIEVWGGYLQDNSEDRCQIVSVRKAGHFWREKGAMDKLREHLAEWAQNFIGEYEDAP